jgi:hypothetical protein
LKVKLTVDGDVGKVGPDKNLQLFQDLERFESVSVLEVGGRDVESEEELNLGQFSNKLVEIVGSTFGQFGSKQMRPEFKNLTKNVSISFSENKRICDFDKKPEGIGENAFG